LDDSDSDKLLGDDIEQMMVLLALKELEDIRKKPGSRDPKSVGIAFLATLRSATACSCEISSPRYRHIRLISFAIVTECIDLFSVILSILAMPKFSILSAREMQSVCLHLAHIRRYPQCDVTRLMVQNEGWDGRECSATLTICIGIGRTTRRLGRGCTAIRFKIQQPCLRKLLLRI
jgi:hypothetical protein